MKYAIKQFKRKKLRNRRAEKYVYRVKMQILKTKI